MGKIVFGLLSGLIFGFGLVISGMSNPAKVLNFLDIFGTFDPSLIFVMGGAVIVVFVGYRLVLRRKQPVFDQVFQIPSRKEIDKNLIMGLHYSVLVGGLAVFVLDPLSQLYPWAVRVFFISFPHY